MTRSGGAGPLGEIRGGAGTGPRRAAERTLRITGDSTYMEPDGQMLGEQGVTVDDGTDQSGQPAVGAAWAVVGGGQLRRGCRRLIHQFTEGRGYSVDLNLMVSSAGSFHNPRRQWKELRQPDATRRRDGCGYRRAIKANRGDSPPRGVHCGP